MSTTSMSTETPPPVAGLTTAESARRGVMNGLIAGAVVIFFILIGLPGGAAAEALPEFLVWGILMAVVAAFGVAAARGKTVVERRSQSLVGSVLAGLLVGILAATMVVVLMVAVNAGQVAELNATPENTTLPNGLRSNITRVQDIFANVNARSTATMSGLPESTIRPQDGTPRADPTGGFVKMSLLLVLAGAVGGGLSYVRHLATLRAAAGGGSLGVGDRRLLPSWLAGVLPLSLPIMLFALVVVNDVLPGTPGALGDFYRRLVGGSTQLIGLLASFLLVGAGLVAVRSTAGARDRGATGTRMMVLVAISVIFVLIGLAAPSPEPSDLMFAEKTPNLVQVASPGGVQVVAEIATEVSLETLRSIRRLVIIGIGLLLIAWNIISARGQASFRGLVAMNILLASMAIAPLFLDRYQQSVLLLVGINVMLGIGLNVVVGYTGLLDLGYAAYFAIGAYTYAFAVSNQDIRQGSTVVGLVYGGNDQWIQNIAAVFVLALITAPIVVAIGMWLWRRSHPVPAATADNPALLKAPHDRPAWLGYALVAACVAAVGLLRFLIRDTPLYDSFSGFPGFIIGLLLSMIVAASIGSLIGIPVLRLRGDYLAIVTLGFGEIVRLMFNNLRDLTGGPQGVATIPRISFGPLEMGSSEGMLYLALLGCVIMAFVALRLKSSRVGRAWGAVRSDEDIAQAMGVNPFKMKVFAYGLAASLAGVAGVLFASRQLSIYPENFNLLVSINVLSLVIIGGMGSIPGVIVGALVLIGVPEALRAFEAYRILVFGALLVAMMLLRPQGMLPEPPFPLAVRAKELWQATKGRAES